MLVEPEVTLTDVPSDVAQAIIDDGLADYNEEKAGYRDWRDLAVLATDPEDGHVLGGLLGRTSLGLLFIDLFYLPLELRQSGIGARVLRAAEDEAIRRGCVSGVLFTISFQAPGFYSRHDWHELARIPCLPPGTSRIVMAKRLAS
jgi:GNAT superfamily N-acetyltransferase